MAFRRKRDFCRSISCEGKVTREKKFIVTVGAGSPLLTYIAYYYYFFFYYYYCYVCARDFFFSFFFFSSTPFEDFIQLLQARDFDDGAVTGEPGRRRERGRAQRRENDVFRLPRVFVVVVLFTLVVIVVAVVVVV